MVVGLEDKDIKVTDGKRNMITSVNRLDELFGRGYKFEACTAISTIVDAYLYFIVNVNCELRGMSLKRKKDSRTGLLKITSGDAYKIIEEHKFIEDKSLLKKIEKFIDERNYMVHNLIKTLKISKFEGFYVICKELIANFHIVITETIPKLKEYRKKKK